MAQKKCVLVGGILGFILLLSGSIAFPRGVYLQEAEITSTRDRVVKGLVHVARKIVFEKQQKKIAMELKQKEEELALLEKELAASRKREARLKRKQAKRQKSKEMDVLRKAAEAERHRRKQIASWRGYLHNKKAAACLVKAIESVDMANQVHMDELQKEIRAFGQDRLHGKLAKYPQLESFLDL